MNNIRTCYIEATIERCTLILLFLSFTEFQFDWRPLRTKCKRNDEQSIRCFPVSAVDRSLPWKKKFLIQTFFWYAIFRIEQKKRVLVHTMWKPCYVSLWEKCDDETIWVSVLHSFIDKFNSNTKNKWTSLRHSLKHKERHRRLRQFHLVCVQLFDLKLFSRKSHMN